MKIKSIMKRKTINSTTSSLKSKPVVHDNEDSTIIKDDFSILHDGEEKTLMNNRNASTETLVEMAENQAKTNQFDAFKAEMLKMFEEQEKKHSAMVSVLNEKIEKLTEENEQYQTKITELEKKLSELENNKDMVSKVQGLEQKVENLEDQYLEQSQSISQREISDDQIAQTIDLVAQNNRSVLDLQKKVNELEKSDAKIIEDHSFMTKEVERLNTFVINNEEIKIFINKRNGSTFSLTATSAETVDELKRQIQMEIGCDIASELLSYEGRVLEDEYTLHDYNINNNSTVQLALRF
ncbi:ubiquitin-like protein [Neocallimastix californiae]|uniref:Ubiquitin-like protein n=1 Tax=Neocallimastix californiae TaxID=1754190 RepID=A0A1Y2D779_9FUNG|nr:ubiquitin-like protein [Neocallimastix californiae]|eukprot:ORY55014.1 ubiquitin-like protein [Neocallimastix californiae]